MKIKILIVNHTPFVGGAQLAIIDLIKKIDREKFNLIIVNSSKAEDLGFVDEYKRLGLKYYLIPFKQLKIFKAGTLIEYIKTTFSLYKIVKREKPEIIFCNTVRADLVSWPIAKLVGIKLVWYINDYTFPAKIFNILKYLPKKIIFVSAYVASFYDLKLESKKIALINAWTSINEKLVSVNEGQLVSLRRNFGIIDGKFVVGFIGRLVELKGPQVLIEAMEILKNQGVDNIFCLIIGSGQSVKNNELEIKKMVTEKGLEERVKFTGFFKDVSVVIKVLDILALTSIEPEGYPTVVVEAMIAGVPSIGTDLGGTSEAVKHEVTGLLVEANNPALLSEAILRLARDNDLRQKIIKNGYEYAIKNNTTEVAAKKLEDIFTELQH